MLGYLQAFEEIQKLKGSDAEILKKFFNDFLAPRLKAYEITLVAVEYMLRDIYANRSEDLKQALDRYYRLAKSEIEHGYREKVEIDSEIERLINLTEQGRPDQIKDPEE
jgi:hypothetical protein